MPKINLNDDDKIRLIEAMNNGVEPSPDLLPKLFPGTAEKFDVVKLDRAKVPTLEYAGKRSKAAILAEAISGSGPLQVERSFGCKSPETDEDYKEWRNMIVQGDNLQFLKTCYKNEDPLIKDKVKGKIDLIYIDPPFGTKSDFSGNSGESSYKDKVDQSEFLDALRERLIYLQELLSNRGTIYVHLDWRKVHYAKVLLDELFMESHFRNEIVWHYGTYVGQTKNNYPKKHDTLLVYSKGITPIFYPQRTSDPDADANYKRWKKYFNERSEIVGSNYPLDDSKFNGYVKRFIDENGREPQFEEDVIIVVSGKLVDSVWEIQSVNPMSKERAEYPTQKPEELLERIIRSCTDENSLVLDVFGGSGTTAAVAEKLGRRWISCDFGKHAIYTQQRRMLRIGESKALQDEVYDSEEVVIKKSDAYKHDPKPFHVVSVGAYDFSHVMSLKDHKDRYVDFVLGLFQLSKDKKVAQSYKLSNIFAEKDKSPVEVYPIWQDDYLKEIRIDEDYLQSIVEQAGAKLSGDYYIIAPETCSNISDTTLKNGSSKVTFHILSFPYKVLEDASRHFQLHDQPSSQDEVNQLVTSTAFYFNDDIEIEAKRNNDGFEITDFKTKILDKSGEPFADFSGIAMILVDQNYDPKKAFDMDETIFSKDIKDGKVKIDLSKSVAIIAIDKHGNESKPTKI